MTTTKADFAEDEWRLLIGAPGVGAVLIVGADFHMFGVPGEFKAMAESAGSIESAGAARDLVAEMVADMQEMDADENDDSPDTDDENWSVELLRLLTGAADIIDRVCTAEEALGYKRWVLNVANAVAEASTEGRFLGIGGERVSDKEKTALAKIEGALGL